MFKKKRVSIEGLDEEAYLRANSDIQIAIEQGSFQSVDEHFALFGFDEIKAGKRRFHPEFNPFDEKLYLEIFPNVSNAYEHFCQTGYQEILKGQSVWRRVVSTSKIVEPYSIKNLNVDSFLAVNSDLATKYQDLKPRDGWFTLSKEDYIQIQQGKRAFHPDYLPFNETLYSKSFKDVKSQINESTTPIDSSFEHFVMSGYEEIINNKRVWSKNIKHSISTIIAIDFDYFWLNTTGVKHNLFYLYLFLSHLNEKKYLATNEDVKNAIESGDFEHVGEHIVYNGMDDFLGGTRDIYENIGLQTSIIGCVDYAYTISQQSLFLTGWLYTIEQMGGIEKIYITDGLRGEEITKQLSYFKRPDLDSMIGDAHKKAGFYGYINSKIIDTKTLSSYWLIIVTQNGVSKEFPLQVEDSITVKKLSQKILNPLEIDTHLYENLTKNSGVAISTYIKEHPISIAEETIIKKTFGEVIGNPKVSVIVPLYGRIDFLEYQLSQFANDAFFANEVQLIYVLDDPSLMSEFTTLVQGVYPIYEVPFTIITYEENYGYAVANNIGVRYAKAPKLLLLNSDVMPLEKGWLSKLIDIYDSLEDVGALAPKLLFEDGSIQHAGMVFEKSDAFKMWLNEHPGKGLPDFSSEQNPKVVPAVTAACLLVDRLLYQKVGGLCEEYLIGDFEDSDLCLKLREDNKLSYYAPSVSLCHLERQSQNLFNDTSWKTKVTLFNGWQHNRKWDRLISELMEIENEK